MLSILQWYPPYYDFKYIYKWFQICHHTVSKRRRRLRHRRLCADDCIKQDRALSVLLPWGMSVC